MNVICPCCAMPGHMDINFDFACERCDFFTKEPLHGQTDEQALRERWQMDRDLKNELRKMNKHLGDIKHQLLIHNRIKAIDKFNIDPKQSAQYIKELGLFGEEENNE